MPDLTAYGIRLDTLYIRSPGRGDFLLLLQLLCNPGRCPGKPGFGKKAGMGNLHRVPRDRRCTGLCY